MKISLASAPEGMSYWEDVAFGEVRTYGPVTISSSLLDQLLDLMGEKHPIHDNDAFAAEMERSKRIVPGGFIHSITSGWMVQNGNPVAVVGLRSVTWDFVRPIYPDTPFHFSSTVIESQEIDDKLGIIKTVRRVFDGEENLHAIGRLNSLILRRPK